MYYVMFIKRTEYGQNAYQFSKPYDSRVKTENYAKRLRRLGYDAHVKTNMS